MTFISSWQFSHKLRPNLNSRPLVTPSNDANVALALTPGHFLIERPLTAMPSSTRHNKTSLSRQIKTIDNTVRQFWKRWKEEYLISLQQKTKWTTSQSRQFAIGDIVIVKEDNIPPLRWPMGRITKVFDGNDNIIRVAQIKTRTGFYNRPVNRFVLLHSDRNWPTAELSSFRTLLKDFL